MSYSIADIIDKLILVEEKEYGIFYTIGNSKDFHQSISTLARVFAKEEERHIAVYKKMKEQALEKMNVELDFFLYDKMSKLIHDFTIPKILTTELERRDLLEYCLELEKMNLALLLSIRGLLVRSEEDVHSENYKVLSEIINEEQKHVSNIEQFLK